ncbi:MAG: hypothetical protein JXR83_14280 [Deltaproteobacteria bacterium]|nr:hypothetical protein [Deltaproteobacteria bacterium]
MKRALGRSFGAPLAMLVAAPLAAATTQYHVISGFTKLAEGDPVSTVLTSDGAVQLGPALDRWAATGTAQVLALVEDGAGGVFVGTGEPGRVLRIGRDGKVATVYEATEPLVTALARDATGALFAATSPDGKIFKIDPTRRRAAVFSEPKAKYVWGLAFDGEALYAVTGVEGAVWRIDRGGKATAVKGVREKNLRCIAVGGSGAARRVAIGGGSKGIVYTIAAGGATRAVFDTTLEEISALAIDGSGHIYAAAVSASEKSGSDDSDGVELVADSGGDRESKAREVKSSEVYRISPTGDVKLLFKSKKDGAYALALVPGALYVATGGRGRLYRVELSDRFSVSLLAKADSTALTGLVAAGPALVVAGSTPGALYRLGAGNRSQGVYLSAPLDAKRAVRPGALRAVTRTPAGTAIEFALRQGNTETVDATWGPFEKIDPGAAPRQALAARYSQVRATLRGTASATPQLRALELAYRGSNRAPQLKKIQILAPGVRVEAMPDDEPKGKTFSVSASAFDDFKFVPGQSVLPTEPRPRVRQTFEQGWQAAAWDGEDDDGDRLSYRVLLTSLDTGAARELARDLDRPFIGFESKRLPDGRYQLTVQVHDGLDNALVDRLDAELQSEPFVIDHTPPQIAGLRAQTDGARLRIQFEGTDLSPLRGAWCSAGGEGWAEIDAVDGLVDQPRERFSSAIELAPALGRPLVVRCTVEDLAGNRGLAEVQVR